MAYTYDDFLSAANKSGMYGQFDDDDLKIAQTSPEYGLSLLSLKKDYGNATTDAQKLLVNEAVNQLRTSYGRTTTPTATSPQGITGVQQTGSFNYDMQNDPSYQAYRKTYLQEGQRASENAIGQASAASAGRPSTAAVTAANQQGNYYASQLAGQIPNLEQNAYNRFITDQQMQKQDMASAYSNLTQLITTAGYQPTEEELQKAGMNAEQAKQLRYNWIVGNPVSALTQGAITPDQYRSITGQDPPGTPKSSGGGSGNGNGFMDKYWTLVNDPQVTSADINNWLVANVSAGNVDATQAKKMLISTNSVRSKELTREAYE